MISPYVYAYAWQGHLVCSEEQLSIYREFLHSRMQNSSFLQHVVHSGQGDLSQKGNCQPRMVFISSCCTAVHAWSPSGNTGTSKCTISICPRLHSTCVRSMLWALRSISLLTFDAQDFPTQSTRYTGPPYSHQDFVLVFTLSSISLPKCLIVLSVLITVCSMFALHVVLYCVTGHSCTFFFL